jgi:hypothetical protein
MAFDAASQRMIMFGGYIRRTFSRGTWSWDDTTWERLHPAQQPPSRIQTDMVYDEARGEIVLFGGATTTEYLGDTWIFKDGEWSQRRPETSPSPRRDFAMAYDVARQEVVLFGGNNQDGDGFLRDTWTWDGESWTPENPTESPHQRIASAMAYDPTRDAVILFGGSSELGFNHDTWAWDGETWSLVPVDQWPRRRYGMALSTFEDDVVLFGGYHKREYADDTWFLEPLGWRQVEIDRSPPGRTYAASGWNPIRREFVMYGGKDCGACRPNHDTWTLSR